MIRTIAIETNFFRIRGFEDDGTGADSRSSRGLFTKRPIKKGVKVTSYSGEIVHLDRQKVNVTTISPDISSYYRSVNHGTVIDGYRDPKSGFGMAQFANDPNGRSKKSTGANCKFLVQDDPGKASHCCYQVFLVTTRDVAKGIYRANVLVHY